MSRITEFLATGFYSGYLKPAPGTWGSWLALCLYITLVSYVPIDASFIALAGGVVLTVIGIPVSGSFATKMKEQDPSYIVIDEFAGLFITFCAVPFSLPLVIIGFLLFRFFDIVKPYPINYLQELPGGWGIMFDDVAAGIYSAFLLSLIHKFVL